MLVRGHFGEMKPHASIKKGEDRIKNTLFCITWGLGVYGVSGKTSYIFIYSLLNYRATAPCRPNIIVSNRLGHRDPKLGKIEYVEPPATTNAITGDFSE